MRYFRVINDQLEEYVGLKVSSNTLKTMGYVYTTNLNNPTSAFKLVDEQIVLKDQQDIEQQQLLIEQQQYQQYYIDNPDLKVRVLAFKQILDTLQLSYQSQSLSPEVIYQAILSNDSIPQDQKSLYKDNALSIWQYGVIFNLKFLNIENAEVFAYYNFDKLVKYLPQNENV